MNGKVDKTQSTIEQTAKDITLKVNSIEVGGTNYLINSRLDNLNEWNNVQGIPTLYEDPHFKTVVRWKRTKGLGEYVKKFELNRSQLTNTNLVFFVIAKKISGKFYFGGWDQTFTKLDSDFANKIDLGNGWYQYWTTFKSGNSIGNAFGLNTVMGEWLFYAAGVLKGNKPTDWSPAPEDIGEIAGSYLKIEKNKITLGSKEITLDGKTIAEAIETEDLVVGDKSGSAYLRIGTENSDKNKGVFRVKASDSTGSLEIDSKKHYFKITSNIEKYTENNGLKPIIQTTDIDATVGTFWSRTDDGDSARLSSQGIYINRAGIEVLPKETELGLKAAIVAHGLGAMNREQWPGANEKAIIGVYGSAYNSSSKPSPAYGGYFDILKANGLVLGIRHLDVEKSVILNIKDTLVISRSDNAIKAYLPPEAYIGTVIWFKQWQRGYMRVYPSEGQRLYDDSTPNEYLDIHEGWTAMCIFIGNISHNNERLIPTWLMSKFRF